MASKFSSCEFGPWALRRVLREEIGPRDRALSWGVVTVRRGDMSEWLVLAASMTPVVGPLLGVALGGVARPGVLVVTRTRLVLLDGGKRPGARGWVRQEIGLGNVEVVRKRSSFVVRAEGEGVSRSITPNRNAKTLRETLRALSEGVDRRSM